MGMYIICPYYKRDRKRSITCEDTIRSYTTLQDKRKVMKELCASEWYRCPYAMAMDMIYRITDEDKMKERLMENRIEEQSKEINKLMRENGQMAKKIKVLEAEIQKMNDTASENFKMYDKTRRENEGFRELRNYLESLAAAFLIVAYGEKAREIKMSKDKVLKLMTEYSLTYHLDPEDQETWVFTVERNVAKGEN